MLVHGSSLTGTKDQVPGIQIILCFFDRNCFCFTNLNSEECLGCESCVEVCETGAITIEET